MSVPIVYEFQVDGETYVTSCKAAEMLGLTQRHIAKMCRDGRSDWRATHYGSAAQWCIVKEDVLQYRERKNGVFGPKVQRKQSTTPVDGYVYIVRAILPTTFVKIGRTKKRVTRLKRLDIVLPFPIEVAHLIPSSDYVWAEAELHRRYSEYRANGEWFELAEAQIAELCAIERLDPGASQQ